MKAIEITLQQVKLLADQIIKSQNGKIELIRNDWGTREIVGVLFRAENKSLIKFRWLSSDQHLYIAVQPAGRTVIERTIEIGKVIPFHWRLMFNPQYRQWNRIRKYVTKLEIEHLKKDTSKVIEINIAIDQAFPEIAEKALLDK